MPFKGITSQEAAKRLDQYGPNLIRTKSDHSAWRLIGRQFESPLVLLLFCACILSVVLGEIIEATAIGAILILNALVGFYQEYKAESALAALIKLTAPRAKVFRDGEYSEILASEVVPGDLLALEAGDVVAADGIVLEAAKCLLNEAILTGESSPIIKKPAGTTGTLSESERENLVFMSTIVVSGTARVEVTATGMNTEFGKIANLLATVPEAPTPLQVQLSQLGRTLLFVSLGIMSVVFAVGLWKNKPMIDLIIFALSLAVAAVPEGMPAIVTIALAVGVRRMAGKNALIRRLSSVETLGSVSVICADKTGTLTTGQMRVRELWGPDHKALLYAATSCCDSELPLQGLSEIGDATEIAILIEARERGIEKSQIELVNPRLRTEPFDSDTRKMTVLRSDGNFYVKGAIESVLPLCVSGTAHREIENAVSDMSARGLRVLAVASGPQETSGLTLMGVIGLADPPRAEAALAIQEARAAGIVSVMITGDHPNTAIAVARELGLLLEQESPVGKVHARAKPEDKLRLVREWKKRGAIVAMTGDGINDAPALREAHVGIAMGLSGTQVTRQSADLVLADDNFATIIAAIKEGRGIYRNIRKAIVYLLAGNFAEIVLVVAAAILGLPVPFLAIHLLWINLVTDSLPALALIADPVPNDVMTKAPRPSNERILGFIEWRRILVVGLLEALSIASLYWIQLQRTDLDHARDLVFTALVASELFRSFSARSRTKIYWQVGILSNIWLFGIMIASLSLQIGIHYIPLFQFIFKMTPLQLSDVLWLLPFALATVTLEEIAKLLSGFLRQPS
ncbi:MAG TPA: cation-translocating P-type ATPase [Bdellovibrio sp.]|uniref:cation-translocating P-type ATPase n=1 Tax=Bdellovibrio sp. TaxID=28201 RepID=UPI002EE451A5